MTETDQAAALEEVRAGVRHAFADVRTPAPDHITLCSCAECSGVREDLAADLWADWAEVPAEKIVTNYDKLPLLTTEAFHYYLPAFMTYSLAHWHSSLVWEFTVYALTPEEKRGENQDWWRERFEPFTPKQMQAIYAFLDLLLSDTEDWFMWTCADQGKRQLAKYTGQE